MTKQNKTVKSWEIDGIGQVSVTPHSAALSPYEPRLREIAAKIIACTHHHKRSATWSPELDALAVLRNELEIESLMETIGLIVETPNVPHPAALQKLREWRDKWKR